MGGPKVIQKLTVLSLVFMLCISFLVACKSEAVTAIENQISAIGEVTVESNDAIDAAESAYDALTEEEKAQVGNYDDLKAAKAAFVGCLIDAIDPTSDDAQNAIDAAEAAYAKLSSDEQALVDNYGDIAAARAAIVVNLIDAIDSTSAEAESAIDAAEAAYAALSSDEQALVDNYGDIAAARAAIVDALIDTIGEVTLESEETIAAAESAFEALSADEQTLVNNAEALTAARATFDALPVLESDYISIDGIYVDDSYSDSDNPGTKLVYLFFTATTPDTNYSISSNSISISVEDTNRYTPTVINDSAAKFAASYYYDSALENIYIGDSMKVVATFKVPEGEFASGRTFTLSGSNGCEDLKFRSDDIVHMSSGNAIAWDIDPEGYTWEMNRRASADDATTQQAQSLLNGYYWTYWTTYPVYTTYRIEFSSPNNFSMSTSLLGGSNGGTYEVTNAYIACTYSSNGVTLWIPYEFKNGDISIDLGAAL